jgi:hypothetical protein
VYYAPTPTTPAAEGEEAEEDETSDEDSDDNDDDTIVSEAGMGDSMFDLDGEDDTYEEEELMETPASHGAGSPYGDDTATRKKKKMRIKVGPPQNHDTKGLTKIPPQVSLKKVENMLHRFSKGIAVEIVHPPVAGVEMVGAQTAGSTTTKKAPLDDFDKLLGLQTKSSNPINRIASGFLGPLMRMIRILVYLVRVSFNVATWRDPYLSSWGFLFLSVVFLILIVFPWRSFIFVSSLVCLGPQVSLACRGIFNLCWIMCSNVLELTDLHLP